MLKSNNKSKSKSSQCRHKILSQISSWYLIWIQLGTPNCQPRFEGGLENEIYFKLVHIDVVAAGYVADAASATVLLLLLKKILKWNFQQQHQLDKTNGKYFLLFLLLI